MKDIKRLLYVLLCAVFFIGLYILSDRYAGETVDKYAHEIIDGNTKLKSNSKVSMTDVSVEDQISNYLSTVKHQNMILSFVGDITFESDQLERYYNSNTESFDFSNSFKYITKYLSTSDYVSCNLEAVLAGPDEDYEDVFDQYGTAGFLYNAPEIAAKNIKGAGISMVQVSNEHTGDFGASGIENMLGYLNEAGLKHTGIKDSTKTTGYTNVSVDGVKIGYVAYTNDLNYSLEDSDPYTIQSLDGYDSDKITEMCNDVRASKRDGAEFVVAMVYAGDPTSTEPDAQQKALFDSLFEAGADIVIGTEPYVVQPMEVRDIIDSDGSTKKGIAIYSLGTFLGSETYGASYLDNDLGAILDIVIDKEGNKKPRITGIQITPTCITYTEDDIFILPVADVEKNPSTYSDIVDETALDRVHTAYEELIPWILKDTNLSGSYSGNTYVINF